MTIGAGEGVRHEGVRAARFSFRCGACGTCCQGKAIRLLPYETLRLARRLGLTTGEFLATCTESGGSVLRVDAEERCLFVDGGRCRVHADRPLACRLYPLGRLVTREGERFVRVPLDPGCRGQMSMDGTIGAYLDEQGVQPFVEWEARYAALLPRLATLAQRLAAEPAPADEAPAGSLASRWLDPDGCLGLDGDPLPDAESTAAQHFAALTTWLDRLEVASAPPVVTAPGG